MNQLLSREQFNKQCLLRDKSLCVFCDALATEVHHILDRKLFNNGGYYLDNGASVCEKCHIKCENLFYTVEDVLKAVGIRCRITPSDYTPLDKLDKWGNIYDSDKIILSELFVTNTNLSKIISEYSVMTESVYKKYPRTRHAPWSRTIGDDDKVHTSMEQFHGKEVVVTEKMDGENCLEGSTLVSTNRGNIPISDIHLYDNIKILSFNHETGQREYKNLIGTIKKDPCKDDEWFEIELENGVKIIATSNHYVWLDNLQCYRTVKNLNIGDDLKQEN